MQSSYLCSRSAKASEGGLKQPSALFTASWCWSCLVPESWREAPAALLACADGSPCGEQLLFSNVHSTCYIAL